MADTFAIAASFLDCLRFDAEMFPLLAIRSYLFLSPAPHFAMVNLHNFSVNKVAHTVAMMETCAGEWRRN